MPAPRSATPRKEPKDPPPPPKRVDRLTDVANHRRLDPGSLVGSFFHGGPEGTPLSAHQGCVVAEVVEGLYLVELFSWFAGDSTHQQLVPISDMTKWQFYDTAEWMNNTYTHGQVPWTAKKFMRSDEPDISD